MAKDDTTEIMKALSRIMGGIYVGVLSGGLIFAMVIYMFKSLEDQVKENTSAITKTSQGLAVLESQVKPYLEQMNYRDK